MAAFPVSWLTGEIAVNPVQVIEFVLDPMYTLTSGWTAEPVTAVY
jgi:hypothetical protein